MEDALSSENTVLISFRIPVREWVAIRHELYQRGLKYGPLIRELLLRELGLSHLKATKPKRQSSILKGE